MTEAFYLPDGEAFVSTELTRGPWDPLTQHAGPPTALLGRAVEQCGRRDDAMVSRITFDILRPVPIAPLTTSARMVRAGRSVELLEAVLSSGDTDIMLARAWRIRTTALGTSAGLDGEHPPPPASGVARAFFPSGQDVGYHTAMDFRFVEGGFTEPGPATVWMRMRRPLVAGEEPSGLQRVLAAADSGNGVSAAVDFTRYVFINTDLGVYLHRHPRGEWVCLDAITVVQPHGVGLAESALFDEHGRLGRSLQTLFVAERT